MTDIPNENIWMGRSGIKATPTNWTNTRLIPVSTAVCPWIASGDVSRGSRMRIAAEQSPERLAIRRGYLPTHAVLAMAIVEPPNKKKATNDHTRTVAALGGGGAI